jgi:hypothetical protein
MTEEEVKEKTDPPRKFEFLGAQVIESRFLPDNLVCFVGGGKICIFDTDTGGLAFVPLSDVLQKARIEMDAPFRFRGMT